MAYATLAALVARFGEAVLVQLTDRANVGAIDEAVVERACLDADSEVDSYLGVRYAVPLTQVDGVVVRLACDIAYYRLHADLDEKHPVARGYKDAVRLLRAYADGSAVLTADPARAPTSVGMVEFEAGRRHFGGGGF